MATLELIALTFTAIAELIVLIILLSKSSKPKTNAKERELEIKEAIKAVD